MTTGQVEEHVQHIVHEINNPVAAMVVNLKLAALEAAHHPALDEPRQLISDTREAAARVRAMPDMTGLELHRTAQQELPELPGQFAFSSGDAYAKRVLDGLPNPKLEKPLNIGELSSLIGEALGGAGP